MKFNKLTKLAFSLLAAGVSLIVAGAAKAESSSWAGATIDDTAPYPEWNDPANWASGVPNGVGDIATFDTLTGRLNLVLSDGAGGAQAITLGGLVVTSQRIDMRWGTGTGTFTWDNNGADVLITHPSAEFLLQHNHVLNDPVKITKSGQQTRFSRLISGPGGFILSGGQEFVLGETATANTFEGGVTVLNNTTVDMRKHNAMGTGAFTFASTATTGKMTPRGAWAGTFANDIVVETSGVGRILEASNHTPRAFSGSISGGGNLTLEHKNSRWQFTAANTITGTLTVQGDGSADLLYGVEGVFGTNTAIILNNAAVFQITSADVFGDTVGVTMDAASVINVAAGLNEVIGSLTVGGTPIPDATYDNTASWVKGDGLVTVGAGGLSSGKDILSFGPGAVITGTNISWAVPFGTDLTTLAPTYTASALATGSPLSGATVNFVTTNPATYTITAQDSTTQSYTVAVSVTPASSAKSILAFGSPIYPAVISGTDITWSVPAGTDLTSLAPDYTVSEFATGSPASGVAPNFATTNPATYTVTAQDNSTQIYTVTVNLIHPTGTIHVSIENSGAATDPATLVGPAGGLGEKWNQPTTATASTLRDSAGVLSSVGYTSSGTSWGGPDVWGNPSLGMLRSALRNFDTSTTNSQQLVIKGLTVDAFYHVWIASAKTDSGSKGEWSTTNDTSTVGVQTADNIADLNGTTWVRGNNYVLFENVKANSSGEVVINGHSLDGYRLPVNGFQLVKVTTPPAAPYDSWASAKGLTGGPGSATDPAPAADPDKDGKSNLYEFGFNGNPLSGSDDGQVYVLTADSDFDSPDTANELILTLAVRKTAPAFSAGTPATSTSLVDGITYAIEGSLDLASFGASVTPVGLVDPGVPLTDPANYQYRSFSLNGSNGLGDKGFLRAKVTQP